MGGWIACSERLPEDVDAEITVEVLVFMDGVIYQAFFEHESRCWFDTDGDELSDSDNPTHWQPLPAPPCT